MRPALPLLLTLSLPCCELLGLGDPAEIVVAGVVLDAETREPVEGLDVILASSCAWSFCTARDWTRTDASGHFRVEYETGDEGNWPLLRVNMEYCIEGWHCTHPYRRNDEYGGFRDRVEPGKIHWLTIEV